MGKHRNGDKLCRYESAGTCGTRTATSVLRDRLLSLKVLLRNASQVIDGIKTEERHACSTSVSIHRHCDSDALLNDEMA